MASLDRTAGLVMDELATVLEIICRTVVMNLQNPNASAKTRLPCRASTSPSSLITTTCPSESCGGSSRYGWRRQTLCTACRATTSCASCLTCAVCAWTHARGSEQRAHARGDVLPRERREAVERLGRGHHVVIPDMLFQGCFAHFGICHHSDLKRPILAKPAP